MEPLLTFLTTPFLGKAAWLWLAFLGIVALVLVFIGGKIFAVNLVGKLPAWVSLSVTLGLLAAGVAYSLVRTRQPAPAAGS